MVNNNGAAWYSSDGAHWSRASIDASDGQLLRSIAVSDVGLFALGGTDNDGTENASVWRSADGKSWQRIAGPGAFSEQTDVYSIAATQAAVVVVGSAFDNGWRATAWTSADGSSWSSPASLAASGRAEDVAVYNATFVAVGGEGQILSPAAWTSTDGAEWHAAGDVPGGGADRDVWLTSVSPGGRGVVATGPSPEGSVGVWTSADANDWVRIPNVEGLAAPDQWSGTFQPAAISGAGASTVVVGDFPTMIPWLNMWAAAVWTNPAPPAPAPAPSPTPQPCPSGKPSLIDVIYLSPADRVRCLGEAQLSFVGFYVPTDNGDGVGCCTPDWLAGPAGLQFSAIDIEVGAATLDGYSRPGTINQPTAHGWFKIAGHFDDPASATCQASGGEMSKEDAVAFCRGRFVITSLQPTTAPPRPPAP